MFKDVVIIGAGVTGSAIARELSKYNLDVSVLEKDADVCTGTSKANSGIVHAGYDALPGTKKAYFNVLGSKQMEKLSKDLDFPYKRNGSIVLCFDKEDIPKLEELKERGLQNGVEGMEILSGDEIRKKEPNLSKDVVAALYVSTGAIVCPFSLTIALAENANMNGVEFNFNSEVCSITKEDDLFHIHTKDSEYITKLVINAAGVYAGKIHNMICEDRNKVLYTYLVDAYHKKTAISSEMHELSLSVFYEYLLIGGMPEAVDIFLETGSYQLSREVLKTLYNNYLSDMDLYQASSESIIRSRKIYEEIFSQLNKESKNFSPSLIGKGLKSRDLLSPIDWLTTSFIVEKSFLVNETVTCPLVSSNDSLFRLYLCDIGMFSYQSNIDPTYFISKESRNYFSGIFFENYVANELTNVGVKLFYWKGKNNSELEFIIQQNYEIIPIDVKKTKGKLGSLEKFKNHNKCNLAIKISSNQCGYDSANKILTIPFYYVFLLCKDIINNSVFEVVKDLN